MERAFLPELPEDVWCVFREVAPVRRDLVAAARARLESGDGPQPLEIADAVLAWRKVA